MGGMENCEVIEAGDRKWEDLANGVLGWRNPRQQNHFNCEL